MKGEIDTTELHQDVSFLKKYFRVLLTLSDFITPL